MKILIFTKTVYLFDINFQQIEELMIFNLDDFLQAWSWNIDLKDGWSNYENR